MGGGPGDPELLDDLDDRGRDTIPYGTDVTLESPLGKLVIATGQFPVDPAAPAQGWDRA
ncbi:MULTISPECIES: hypothetical protein [unclassified Streptomyces]|uniref:hypothetical protein n=1 Tax=unclassified Streptomyces TaxID=2593676 RepID=UPI00278BD97B|nr:MULTISPECIES: hypothetical protein [unclassified Streptomyces]